MPSRQAVYRGLLSAIGRYFYHYARNPRTDETVEFDDDEPLKPIIDWVMDGDEPVVQAFHVWGVGQAEGGSRGDHAYSYCKDRRIEWGADEGAWSVRESNKYVVDAHGAAPGDAPEGPERFTETRHIQV